MFVRVCLLMATVALVATGVAAATWTVQLDGNGDFTAIQPALAAAASGDTILVADGVYEGPGNRDLSFGGKDLVLLSVNDLPASCVIDCLAGSGNEHRGFVFQGTETAAAVVRGFTVRGGWASGPGGGILCSTAGVDSLPSPRIEHCVLTGNTAATGGGIAVVGDAHPRLVDCDVTANIGGGAFWAGVHPDTVDGFGRIEACTFVGNTGDGVVLTGDRLAFVGNLVASNSGNGLTLSGGPFSEPVEVSGSTIAHNSLHGIANLVAADLQVSATIIAFNDQDAVNGGADLSCTDLYGNLGGDFVGSLAPLLGVQGNFSADPIFCDGPAGDYGLNQASACADGNHPDGAACGLVGAAGVSCPPLYLGPTWYVSETGDDLVGNGSSNLPFATIQLAIDIAAPGDTVEVFSGQYGGDGNRDLDLGGKNLTVRSQTGNPADCVIVCDGQSGDEHRGFALGGLETRATVIRGFTIEGGWVSGDGGGILCAAAGVDSLPAPRIQDCVVTGNTAARGAGIAVVGRCKPEVVGCFVMGNTGSGAAWLGNGSGIAGGSLIEDCRFELNTGPGLAVDCLTMAGDMHVHHSDFATNGGHGLLCNNGLGFVRVDSCLATGNGGWGFFTSASAAPAGGVPESYEAGVRLFACTATQNTAGGIRAMSERNIIRECTVADNLATGIRTWSASYPSEVTGCTVRNNQGHGIDGYGALLQCIGNVVDGNHLAGVRVTGDLIESAVSENLIVNNLLSGVLVTASYVENPLVMHGNTIAGNLGHGVECVQPADLAVSGTLIAYNGLQALSGYDSATDLSCTNLYGNNGGDWVGDLAGLLGQQGNISAEPGFCDRPDGDYEILEISPCAPGNHPDGWDCDGIGALGVGCLAAPYIAAVADVGNDQGRQVRLSWAPSHFDAEGSSQPTVNYGVYRRQDEYQAEQPRKYASVPRGAVPMPGWDFLISVPARGDTSYQYVAPTLCDSTAMGVCWSTFIVSALTDDPYTYYDSEPAAGYSVDNLVPPAPELFTVTYGPQNQLEWQGVEAPDLVWYNVYRDTTEVFETSPANLCAQIAGTTWTDAQATWGVHYRLSAVDDATNESERVAPSHVAAVPAPSVVATVLVGNTPNPFNPATTIAFTLAGDLPVKLRVYDLGGRLVRNLVDDELLVAGRHEVVWRGQDDGGRAMASGLYLYRLQAGDVVETRRMALIR